MTKVETAKWILAAVCFVPAAFFIVMNWLIFRHNLKSRRSNLDSFSSWVPLLGGLLGALSFWLAPVPEMRRFWWVPFVIDYGCVIGLTETAIYWSKYNRQGNEPHQKP
jgi:hypothetical protein